MTITASCKALVALLIAVAPATAFAADTAAPVTATPAPAVTARPVSDTASAAPTSQQPSQLQGFSSGSGQSIGPMQVNPLFGGARPMQGAGGGKW